MISTAAFLSLALQCASTVHPDTAHDVAKIESGFNPYAIAEIIPKAERLPGDKGVISHLPKSKEEALNIVNRIEAKNRRYSIGLMQITSTNFKQFGMTAEKLLSPCNNLSVFEKIITDCYLRGKTMIRTLSCYYSGNFTTGQKKEKEFGATSYVERVGYSSTTHYVVPSTKQDKASNSNSSISASPNTKPKPRIVYPSQVVRGEFVLTNGE